MIKVLFISLLVACTVQFVFAQTCDSFTDPRDGQTYKTVKIGKQVWMAENLNYEVQNGSACYDNNSSNCKTYGMLYNWETAKSVCPNGWHLPSDSEWQQLEISLEMRPSEADNRFERGTNEGSKLSGNLTLWKDNNKLANNVEFGTSGFFALPGGYWSSYDGLFYGIGKEALFWSDTEEESLWYWVRKISYNSSGVSRFSFLKSHALSVRCLKD